MSMNPTGAETSMIETSDSYELGRWVVGGVLAMAMAVFPQVAQPEQLLSVAEVIAKARPVTDHDPAVHTMLLRGHMPIGEAIFAFRYSYQAPKHYTGLSALRPPSATYFAAVDSRAFQYDPIAREISAFADVIPGIRWIIVNRSMQIAYKVNWKGTGPSQSLEDGVFIDVPSILTDPSVTIREVQRLETDTYRLTGMTGRGDAIVVTIDTKQDLVTDIELGAEAGNLFVQMRVNATPLPPDPAIVPSGEIRLMTVKDRPRPKTGPEALKFAARMTLPMAAVVPAMRQPYEFVSGEKPDWTMVEANMKQDALRLQQTLPFP